MAWPCSSTHECVRGGNIVHVRNEIADAIHQNAENAAVFFGGVFHFFRDESAPRGNVQPR